MALYDDYPELELDDLYSAVGDMVSTDLGEDDPRTGEAVDGVFETLVYWPDWYVKSSSASPTVVEGPLLDAIRSSKLATDTELESAIYNKAVNWQDWYWVQKLYSDTDGYLQDRIDHEDLYAGDGADDGFYGEGISGGGIDDEDSEISSDDYLQAWLSEWE